MLFSMLHKSLSLYFCRIRVVEFEELNMMIVASITSGWTSPTDLLGRAGTI